MIKEMIKEMAFGKIGGCQSIKGENVAKEGRFKKTGGRAIGGCQSIEGEIV